MSRELYTGPRLTGRMLDAVDQTAAYHAIIHEEEKNLVAEIRKIGVAINKYDNIFYLSEDEYIRIVPILIDHLGRKYTDAFSWGMANALRLKPAREMAWDVLIDYYQRMPDYENTRFKDGLASAISDLARASDFETLVKLYEKPANGRTRGYFSFNFSRMRRPEGLQVLLRNRHDPDIKGSIEQCLAGKRKRGLLKD